MATPTVSLEFYLSASWTDVWADVRLESPVSSQQGILGSGPTDRVASPGSLSFSLDNSELNSAGKLGYYSPNHANLRAGFGVGTRVRLKLVYGANTLYAFHGRILKIEPSSGPLGRRVVDVTVGDFMYQMSVHKLNLIPVQLAQRNDQLITTLFANMVVQPLNTTLAVGPETMPTALNSETDEKSYAITTLQKLMQSGLDYAYVKGNTTDGETFVYESRHTRQLNVTSEATFTDTMKDLKLVQDAEGIYNIVKAVAYPDRYDASAVVLWAAASEIALNAGQSITTTARFRDPSGLSQRTSVYPGSEVTPVSVTDYKMSSVSGNGGSDLNSYLTVTVTWGGNSADITVLNTGDVTGYINLLQLRGRGIYHYDPITVTREDAASQAIYGDKELAFNMPYQGSANLAKDFADDILAKCAYASSRIQALTFTANRSDALMAAALTCLIGDRITVTETATGISGDFYINSVGYNVSKGNILEVTWLLQSAANVHSWVLNDAVLSVLGTSTYLSV